MSVASLCDDTLTDIDPKHLSTAPGMAHWAGTGPADTVCQQCIYWKYVYDKFNSMGEAVGNGNSRGCRKFHELTGTHGPKISGNLRSCKYFTAKG